MRRYLLILIKRYFLILNCFALFNSRTDEEIKIHDTYELQTF